MRADAFEKTNEEKIGAITFHFGGIMEVMGIGKELKIYGFVKMFCTCLYPASDIE